jgi:DNA mismatch repair protein MutS2
MNEKSAHILELPKILEQLANFASFSAGSDVIRALRPSSDPHQVSVWQQQTAEARAMLEAKSDINMGGARDVRAAALQTLRGIVLDTQTLLDIRGTLRRATTLKRSLLRVRNQYPALGNVAELLEECSGLQGEISRTIDENGNVLDSASPKLAIIRRDLRVASERLQAKLNALITNSNNAKYLQEQLITQRNGRYVIPLRSEFKGRIPGIVHDQSSSGATIFIEPLATVELNNTVRECQLAEEEEIHRILRELSELVANEADFIVRSVEALAELDMIFAKARYADSIKASAPRMVDFQPRSDQPNHPGGALRFMEARHPLLNPHMVVPIDLMLDDATYLLIITGPNTGGKTVALKTIGLLAMMAQCGLHLPTLEGAEFTVFDDIFADIGDEQSIEQSLSTFSSHMTNIRDILGQATGRSLVILDELGAGTDPAEGAALARAILSDLRMRGITTLVTTHHPELKLFSQSNSGSRNASVEFDLETLRPTYRLMVGIPGRSNALAIAQRIGLPQPIIEEARGMVSVEDMATDNLLDEITKTREETRRARDSAIQQQQKAEQLAKELRQRIEESESEQRDVVAKIRRNAERELEDLRKEIRTLRQKLQQAGQPLEAIKRLEENAFNMRPDIDMPTSAMPRDLPLLAEDQPIYKLGEKVWISRLKTEGEITEISATDVEVAIGRMRVRAKLDEIEKRGALADEKKQRNVGRGEKPKQANVLERAASPGLEIDLRGERVEDALEKINGYLDAAYMAGLPFVRVIHGKGTGALRKAIRDILRGHTLVERYESGGDKDGGDGVTLVNLVAQ